MQRDRSKWTRRELPLKVRGKTVMIEADARGVWVWKKKSRTKQLVSWTFIVETALMERALPGFEDLTKEVIES